MALPVHQKVHVNEAHAGFIRTTSVVFSDTWVGSSAPRSAPMAPVSPRPPGTGRRGLGRAVRRPSVQALFTCDLQKCACRASCSGGITMKTIKLAGLAALAAI